MREVMGSSLRLRLTVLAALVSALVAGAASVTLLLRLQSAVLGAVDTLARDRARVVASSLHGRLPVDPVLPGARSEVVVQVLDSRGVPVAATANATGLGRLFPFPGKSGIRTAHQVAVRSDTIDYRVAVVRSGDLTVYAGAPVDDMTDATHALALQLAVGAPALVLLATLATWLVVGRALRPVEQLRREAAAIAVGDRSQRLAVPHVNELGRLATTLNDLIRGLDDSLRHQRSFVADAAHELRSPIASLTAQLELQQRLHSGPDAAQLMAQVNRLSRLTDDLLALARLDAGGASATQIELGAIVRELASVATAGRDITIDLDLVPARVLVDSSLLRRVVGNLLDNAVRHARQRVRVELSTSTDGCTLVIADDGPGVAAADRERIFDRFTRLDESRSRDEGGAGLGLAIVREAVHRAGGTVLVEDGARFVVHLPLS